MHYARPRQGTTRRNPWWPMRCPRILPHARWQGVPPRFLLTYGLTRRHRVGKTMQRAYQFHSRKTHQPAQALQTIPLSWPSVTWGLDLLGPFPTAPGRFKFLIVTIDTFTKWIEGEPLTKITAAAAQKFVQRNIFTCFDVPSRIITDNGT